MNYRREIDGLRALAVLPVIFFHAGFEAFSGGFVGVDIFFVISGYLITSLILQEQEAGHFSLLHFYERRARRILPALLLVMGVCIPLAWWWLVPSDMQDFSQSLVAASLFSSNILFWRESGYFEPAAELKPLLHTWSLAVEEQYYLLFPLFMMLARRWGRRWMAGLLAVATLASLLTAHWASLHHSVGNFYLLPTRGWELGLGALAAFYLTTSTLTVPQLVYQAMSALGLAMIAYAVFVFDSATPFPSLYALTPTVGALLIILFASPATMAGRLLGSRLLVGIGLVSYSAYLWHYPLFVFARHSGFAQHNALLVGWLSVASFVLAYFSWKYVEMPFRKGSRFSRRQVFAYASAASAVMIAFGLGGHISRGYEMRFAAGQKEYLAFFENSLPEWRYFTQHGISQKYREDCDFYDLAKYRAGQATQKPIASIAASCYELSAPGQKSVFIWGDSHAQQFHYGLRRVLPAQWDVLQVASSGCIPRLDAVQDSQNYCDYSNGFAYSKIRELKPGVVIIGQNLGYDIRQMQEMAQRLLADGVGKVIFAGPTPHWLTELPKLVAQRFWPNIPRRTLQGINPQVMELDKILKAKFPQSASVRYVSVIDFFCHQDGCLISVDGNPREGITTWDYGHLTPRASQRFAEEVLAREVLE